MAERSTAITYGLLVGAIALGLSAPARASFDEFSDERVPTHFVVRGTDDLSLAIKGELNLGLHDLEGEGGPGRDSPTDTRTIGTRSPNVEIDAFWLALRLAMPADLSLYSVLSFGARDTRVGQVWLDWRRRTDALLHHVEFGYQRPIVALNRRTDRFPLAANVYWRESELHLAYEVAWTVTDAARVEAGASVAMMRPLDFAPVQQSRAQSGTISQLVYGPARTFSGNAPVAGGRAKFAFGRASIEAFGFLGRLSTFGGTDVLRSGFSTYRQLPGYTTDDGLAPFAWGGGRAGFEGKSLHFVVEGIASQEDLLRRWSAYAQLSWRHFLPGASRWLHSVEPLVRVETSRLVDADRVHAGVALRSPALINAVSWDWHALTLALATELLKDVLFVRLEYSFLAEDNGVPALGLPHQPFANDELLVQAVARF